MGNIAFNSFPKNMSDEAFSTSLREICQERFGDLVEVRETFHNGKLCSWVVGPKENTVGDDSWRYEWEVYRESKRKFGGKHPRSDWGSYLMAVVQNELAFRYNGRISDEGVSGTWKGDPTKYKTFVDYFRAMNKFTYKNYPEVFNQLFEYTPEKLREH